MIGAAITKDLQLLVRDRGALVTMFLLPVVFIAVFGSIFGGGGGDARRRLAVVADPASPRAVAVARWSRPPACSRSPPRSTPRPRAARSPTSAPTPR
ncbi:MAG: hypothetical protein IPL61_14990 [Myxococcales bacterium]|nr:hypothetical protein [Myxococcales bacterium]